jgi:hypothetical protein
MPLLMWLPFIIFSGLLSELGEEGDDSPVDS